MVLLFAVFLVLHGLVHLLYVGQSVRAFELQPGLTWPDGSWALSVLVGDRRTRVVVGVVYALICAAFIASAAGLLLKQPWWQSILVAAAAFSIVVIILLWDGRLHRLADQGANALVISAAILVAVLGLRWPAAVL